MVSIIFQLGAPARRQGKLGKSFLSREKLLFARGSDCSLAPRLAELGACGFGQGFEGVLIVDRHIREDLSVKLDIGFFQSINKLAVVHALRSDCGVDPGNPESTKLALAVFPIAIGVAQTMLNGLPGFTETGASHTAVAFG
tara:strand:- start:540 stop:962 length:423 start_codon:yes stop_codon:yes gene_type:complete